MLWKRVCAWCDKGMGYMDARDNNDYKITHGICKDCLQFIKSNKHQTLREFITKFDLPLFVVDKDGRICSANPPAEKKVNKSLCDIKGKLGGNVFECENARKPGGCGKTVHCVGCTIRRTVTTTFETGKGVEKKTAIQKLDTPKGPEPFKFLISTEKVNDAVFLRLDSMEPCTH